MDNLITSSERLERILTHQRKQIINLLDNQNSLTEEKLNDLFKYDTHQDLNLLYHFNLIYIDKVDNNSLHNIIRLNKDIKLV